MLLGDSCERVILPPKGVTTHGLRTSALEEYTREYTKHPAFLVVNNNNKNPVFLPVAAIATAQD